MLARSQTLESLLDFLHGRLWGIPQEGVHGHDNSWGAESTLRAMGFGYSLLNRSFYSLYTATSKQSICVLFHITVCSPAATSCAEQDNYILQIQMNEKICNVYLDWVKPTGNTPNSFHSGDSCVMERTNWGQAGINGIVTVKDVKDSQHKSSVKMNQI